MVPGFDLGPLGGAAACARAAMVGGLCLVLGTLLLRTLLLRRLLALPALAAPARSLDRLVLAGAAASAAATLAWLGVQSAILGDAADPWEALASVPAVLGGTGFGHLVIARLALLGAIAGAAALRRGWAAAVATALAVVALALQAGHLHALAMQRGPSLLLGSEVAHVLAAGAWLGALPGLGLLVQRAPPALAAAAARRFSPLGAACVLALAGSAAWQSWVLLGGVPGAIGTAYGWVCLAKALLLAVLLRCALRNRLVLLPRLAREGTPLARRALARSIGTELAAGALAVLLAAVLAGLQPGQHLQPVWPFRVRPSLVAVAQHPALAREAMLAGAALLAASLLAASLLAAPGLAGFGPGRRRWRWPALAAAAAIAWAAAPHLGPLLVPAYPTSFYRSPTRFAADSIADGAALFPAHCAPCHGASGRGDGPQARLLPVPPANLTLPHLWAHTDGELFWWLTAGMRAPDGAPAMPGFAAVLDAEQRWALIDYLRAHNAGLVFAIDGDWLPPVLAPSFLADCGGEQAVPVGDPGPAGRRIVFLARGQAGPPPLARPGDPPVITVAIPPVRVVLPPTPRVCVASDPAIRTAYAVALGLPAARLDGLQVLVDRNGWLRDAAPQGPLGAAARRALTAPLPRGAVFAMQHHH